MKSSQESKGKGKGSNNPQLAKASKHKLMRQVASGDSIASIQRNNQSYFDDFEIFHYSPDNRVRAAPSASQLNKLRQQLPLANKEQIDAFIDAADRLTLGTDGVSTFYFG